MVLRCMNSHKLGDSEYVIVLEMSVHEWLHLRVASQKWIKILSIFLSRNTQYLSHTKNS